MNNTTQIIENIKINELLIEAEDFFKNDLGYFDVIFKDHKLNSFINLLTENIDLNQKNKFLYKRFLFNGLPYYCLGICHTFDNINYILFLYDPEYKKKYHYHYPMKYQKLSDFLYGFREGYLKYYEEI